MMDLSDKVEKVNVLNVKDGDIVLFHFDGRRISHADMADWAKQMFHRRPRVQVGLIDTNDGVSIQVVQQDKGERS